LDLLGGKSLYALGFFFGGQRMVQNTPGQLIGPIAMVFGYIIDFIFNVIYSMTVYHSLGLSIILLTVIVRALMLPLAMKQQKSMTAMQKLAPEIDKIKKKYPNKDKESQQKMNAEIQKTYADNKVNPLGGCLPLFVQMPMFFGLSFIMNQSYLYVSRLGNLYSQISAYLIEHMPFETYIRTMNELAVPLTPDRMITNGEINLTVIPDVNRVLNVFGSSEWSILFERMPIQYLAGLEYLDNQKTAIETFFGISLIEASGLGWPGILIPILAVATAVLTSYLTTKVSVATDDRAKAQQKMMMVIMPIMMGAMTIGLPAGVGIFWITSSVFQVGQQVVLNRKSGIPLIPMKKGA